MNLGMVFKVTILSTKIQPNLWYGVLVYSKPKKHVQQRKLVNEQLKLFWTSTSILRSTVRQVA